jgi:hypothetical protein
MAKLIYSMLTSLDGYTEDEHGQFGWGAPEDASASVRRHRREFGIRAGGIYLRARSDVARGFEPPTSGFRIKGFATVLPSSARWFE